MLSDMSYCANMPDHPSTLSCVSRFHVCKCSGIFDSPPAKALSIRSLDCSRWGLSFVAMQYVWSSGKTTTPSVPHVLNACMMCGTSSWWLPLAVTVHLWILPSEVTLTPPARTLVIEESIQRTEDRLTAFIVKLTARGRGRPREHD